MGDLERRRYSLSPMDAKTEVRLTRAQRLALREVEAQGSIERQAAIEQAKLAATRADGLFAVASRAAIRYDEVEHMVRDLGLDSERSELAGGRFLRAAARRVEGIINDLYGPLDG